MIWKIYINIFVTSQLKIKNMTIIGTPLSKSSTKVLLCGSGELGKEIAIVLQK